MVRYRLSFLLSALCALACLWLAATATATAQSTLSRADKIWQENLIKLESGSLEGPTPTEQHRDAPAQSDAEATQTDPLGGWGGGSFEMQSQPGGPQIALPDGPQECSSSYLDTQLKRIDLAMGDKDLDRWTGLMAEAINLGCVGSAIDSRIERAASLDASRNASRDNAMAAAASNDRPELRASASKARSLNPSNQSSDWLAVAGVLTQLATDYKASQRPGTAKPGRSNHGSDTVSQAVYADIFADTKGTVEVTPENNKWDQVYGQVSQSSGNTLRKDVSKINPEDDAQKIEPSPGGAGNGSRESGAAGISTGSLGSGDSCYPAAESSCAEFPGKRSGDQCQCCPGVYGIEQCYWGGGSAPQPVHHKTCQVSRNLYDCPSTGGSKTVSFVRSESSRTQSKNDTDFGTFYKDDDTRIKRAGVADTMVSVFFKAYCTVPSTGKVVAGPLTVGPMENLWGKSPAAQELKNLYESCCNQIGANTKDMSMCRYNPLR